MSITVVYLNNALGDAYCKIGLRIKHDIRRGHSGVEGAVCVCPTGDLLTVCILGNIGEEANVSACGKEACASYLTVYHIGYLVDIREVDPCACAYGNLLDINEGGDESRVVGNNLAERFFNIYGCRTDAGAESAVTHIEIVYGEILYGSGNLTVHLGDKLARLVVVLLHLPDLVYYLLVGEAGKVNSVLDDVCTEQALKVNTLENLDYLVKGERFVYSIESVKDLVLCAVRNSVGFASLEKCSAEYFGNGYVYAVSAVFGVNVNVIVYYLKYLLNRVVAVESHLKVEGDVTVAGFNVDSTVKHGLSVYPILYVVDKGQIVKSELLDNRGDELIVLVNVIFPHLAAHVGGDKEAAEGRKNRVDDYFFVIDSYGLAVLYRYLNNLELFGDFGLLFGYGVKNLGVESLLTGSLIDYVHVLLGDNARFDNLIDMLGKDPGKIGVCNLLLVYVEEVEHLCNYGRVNILDVLSRVNVEASEIGLKKLIVIEDLFYRRASQGIRRDGHEIRLLDIVDNYILRNRKNSGQKLLSVLLSYVSKGFYIGFDEHRQRVGIPIAYDRIPWGIIRIAVFKGRMRCCGRHSKCAHEHSKRHDQCNEQSELFAEFFHIYLSYLAHGRPPTGVAHAIYI